MLTIQLRGMTWDHERGYAPLVALSKLFSDNHPHVRLQWDRRSLKDFGDFPVDKLAEQYDIIMIDHPHVGICAEQEVLVQLDRFIPEPYLLEQERSAVGPSYRSYQWKGHQYALAVDAAAQVSAYREDLMRGRPLPKTWDQVMALSTSAAGAVGWPLCPTDAMCSFLTLCADAGGFQFFDTISGIRTDAGVAAISRLFDILPHLHSSSLSMNPIQMFDHMVGNSDIAYVPLAFGYTNYARAAFGNKRLRYTDIPSSSGKPKGSLLGGVGIAVSSHSQHVSLAVAFAMLVADPLMQRTAYFQAGGQPGHAAAWTDEEVNEIGGRFFADTWQTLQHSYMRPRNRAFPAFQEQAGVLLHEALGRRLAGEQVDAAEIVKEMNLLYRELLKEG